MDAKDLSDDELIDQLYDLSDVPHVAAPPTSTSELAQEAAIRINAAKRAWQVVEMCAAATFSVTHAQAALNYRRSTRDSNRERKDDHDERAT